MLELDNAGWHSEPDLTVPDGIRLVYLPPYTPELQPAETLWTLVDEPIGNKHITNLGELEEIIARRCIDLAEAPERINSQTQFHRWPTNHKAELIIRKSYDPQHAGASAAAADAAVRKNAAQQQNIWRIIAASE